MKKTDLSSMTLTRLEEYITALGQPGFRAKQIYSWLHQKKATAFEEMTNLPASLRGQLAETAFIATATTEIRQLSGQDDTRKYLLRLRDDNCVETVLMQYKHGASLCISTQVGCRMGCSFCASTVGGLVRGLTAGEMLAEVYAAERETGKPVDSLVLMGIGEPLDNLDNVLTFLEILSSPEGRGMSLRHVSLSTCGLVDAIDILAAKKLGLTLSVSLHAADDETRSAIMPVNRRWPIDDLMAACKRYFAATGRRISYEYALIDGVNDSEAHARRLAKLLGGQNCHINLIPVNPVEGRNTRRSKEPAVQAFARLLNKLGLNATVRRELGSDISAACGQLRSEQAKTRT